MSCPWIVHWPISFPSAEKWKTLDGALVSPDSAFSVAVKTVPSGAIRTGSGLPGSGTRAKRCSVPLVSVAAGASVAATARTAATKETRISAPRRIGARGCHLREFAYLYGPLLRASGSGQRFGRLDRFALVQPGVMAIRPQQPPSGFSWTAG